MDPNTEQLTSFHKILDPWTSVFTVQRPEWICLLPRLVRFFNPSHNCEATTRVVCRRKPLVSCCRISFQIVRLDLSITMPAPSEGLYCPPTPAPHAFSAHGKTPSLGLSGSSWGLKQIQHCYINFKSDLEAIQLIVSPDLVPDNSIIAAHLRQTLSREWLDILKSCETNSGQQPLSTLDRSLGELASLKWSEHSYHSSSSLELKSSPPIDQSPSNPSLEEQRKTQTPTHSPESSMRTSPSPLSSSPLARYSTSHLLPAQSQEENNLSIEQRNFPSSTPPETTRSFVGIGSPPRLALSSKPGDLRIRSHSTSSAETDLDETASQAGNAQGHADWSPQPELPRHRPIVQQHEVKTSPLQPRLVPYSSSSPLVEHRSSPSAHSNASLASRHNLGLDPVPEEDRDERSVECVTRLFIGVIIDSIRAAASAPTRSNPKGWIIRDQVE